MKPSPVSVISEWLPTTVIYRGHTAHKIINELSKYNYKIIDADEYDISEKQTVAQKEQSLKQACASYLTAETETDKADARKEINDALRKWAGLD